MDLEGLQRLQEIDLERDAATRELQVVFDQIADPPFISALEAEATAQESEAQRANQLAREAHALVQTAQRRIDVTDRRLYSGAITEHRVLEELQRELYSQRQQLPPMIEAEQLAGQVAELAQEAVGWLQQLREQALDHWNEQQSTLKVQRGAHQERVDEFSRQIEILRDLLDGDDLAIYDQYRRRRPRVVTTVTGGVCDECRLTLPTIVVTRARRGTRIVECPSCGCLLRVS